MFMRTESYDIVIPEKARVMTEEEMEYEGGLWNFIASAALFGASLVCDYCGYKEAAIACSVGSCALSFGLGAATLATTTATTVTKEVAKAVVDTTVAPGAKAVYYGVKYR